VDEAKSRERGDGPVGLFMAQFARLPFSFSLSFSFSFLFSSFVLVLLTTKVPLVLFVQKILVYNVWLDGHPAHQNVNPKFNTFMSRKGEIFVIGK
jgi:hypothetical protein